MTNPTTEQSSREPDCPNCGAALEEVRQDPDSMLNSEQFDACKKGDWFCRACPEQGQRYRYFWTRDLTATRPTLSGQTAESGWNAGNTAAHGDFSEEIAALPAQATGEPSGWISVDDRKPEKFVEVLIAFRDTPLPATGQYTASDHDTWGWNFPAENDPDDTGPITHWMPLPPAPISAAPQKGDAA